MGGGALECLPPLPGSATELYPVITVNASKVCMVVVWQPITKAAPTTTVAVV